MSENESGPIKSFSMCEDGIWTLAVAYEKDGTVKTKLLRVVGFALVGDDHDSLWPVVKEGARLVTSEAIARSCRQAGGRIQSVVLVHREDRS